MQITGKAHISVNGTLQRSKNGAKLNFGNPTREEVMGDNGVDGFTEQPTVPMIECTVSHSADVSLTDYTNITDGTITFETDTGKTFVLRNAWLSNSLELTANESGELPLTFKGKSCEEV